jgi:predicted ATPase
VQKGNPDDEKLEPGKLELRVTSSRRPNETYPTNVLNGQAAKALQLVPYFVFSDFWKDIMELDLLLIDDPSESFDTSHIEHLMNMLKGVASHTQLVLATHQEEEFRLVTENLFVSQERCIVRVTDFDPEKGPSLEPP